MSVVQYTNQKIEKCKDYFPFTFSLDNFQLYGCQNIDKMNNLLVTAHTGSGKTVFALYGIAKHLNEGNRIIYISPIKTLSNQKYKEFSQYFPSVGILTGDIKLNPDASCLIMTAEILRNFLKSSEYPSYFNMDNVSCIVLDEIHYINNIERGKVWEEILIYLDSTIQLIMLSATISEPLEFGKWICKLKNKDCHIISTQKRPVPLIFSIFWENNLHTFLSDKWKQGIWTQIKKDVTRYYKEHRFTNHLLFECIQYIKNKKLYPCIVFLLNKGLVEKIAKILPITFIDSDQIKNVDLLFNKYLHKYKEYYQHTEQWNIVLQLAQKGIGIHHSGMIPILKEMVEILYTEGLISILFATETFAMGVNAPTKSVIFTNLEKYDGKQKRLLTSDEFNQMAGRAGRRGMDDKGEVIILPNQYFLSEDLVYKIILSPPPILKSHLELNYSLFMGLFSSNDTIIWNKNILENTFFYEKNKISFQEIHNPIEYTKIEPYYNIYLEIKNIESQMNPFQDSMIRINKKLEKKLLKEKQDLIQKMGKDLFESCKTFDYYETKIKDNEFYIQSQIQQWDQQLSLLKDFFHKKQIIADNQWTKRGIIMKNINEGNSLWLSNILLNDILIDLDLPSLIAILSLFIVESEKTDFEWNHSYSVQESSILNKIEQLKEQDIHDENNLLHQLPFPFKTNWDTSRTMFQVCKMWISDCSWQEIHPIYNDFEGNFIKNMIRICNFSLNILEISKIIQCFPLIQKLEGIENKIIRDLVIQDSLYISSIKN
jgi:superfamily II RNA helicase